MTDGLQIGYALGGGSARGLAHIGALKVLEEKDIYPDIIVGTSMGAVIGALYAGGYKARDIERLAVGLDWRRLLLYDISLSAGGFLQGKRVVTLLKSILGDLSFDDLKFTYACTATDVITGEEVIFTGGSLVDAIHASIALPGIFKPVRVEGHYLVDGGLRNEVPAGICRRLGARYVIGINAIPDPEKVMLASRKNRKQPTGTAARETVTHENPADSGNIPQQRLSAVEKAITAFIHHHSRQSNTYTEEKPPTLLEVVRQSITIMQYHVAVENLKSADLAISPDLADVGFWQFNRAAEAIAAGEKATRTALAAMPKTAAITK